MLSYTRLWIPGNRSVVSYGAFVRQFFLVFVTVEMSGMEVWKEGWIESKRLRRDSVVYSIVLNTLDDWNTLRVYCHGPSLARQVDMSLYCLFALDSINSEVIMKTN